MTLVCQRNTQQMNEFHYYNFDIFCSFPVFLQHETTKAIYINITNVLKSLNISEFQMNSTLIDFI